MNQVDIKASDDNNKHILNGLNLTINKGDRFAQGIFSKYLLVDDDSSDSERAGGFGSTGKGD